jgi:PAS domain S-box-containing protein
MKCQIANYLLLLASLIPFPVSTADATVNPLLDLKNQETNSQKQIALTESERAYLRDKGTLTVCARINPGNSTMLPIEAMAGRLQTSVRMVQTQSFEQTMELVKEGRCDIVPIAVPTPIREKYLDFTTPWLNIPYTIAARDETPYFDDISAVLDKSFCVIKEYAVADYLRKTYPGIRLEEVADAKEGLRRVKNGSVFAMVDLIPMTIDTIQSEGITGIKIVAKLEKRAEMATGTRKDEPLLHSAFQKAVDSLTPAERQAALNYMISVKYENAVNYQLVWRIIGAGLLLAGLVIAWGYYLRRTQTALSQVNRSLSESVEKYRLLTESIGELLASVDFDLKFTFWNRMAEQIFDVSVKDIIGKTAIEIFGDNPGTRLDNDKYLQCIKTKSEINYQKEHLINNKRHYFDVSLFPTESGITILSKDISVRKEAEAERNKLEQQLLHTQKLESLGVLAGGIAHDFNNLLMAMIGNLDLAKLEMQKESPAFEYVTNAETAASRAADLTRQMLAYSGKGKFVIQQIDLNALLEEMLHLLQVSISKKSVLRLNLAQNLPAVEADATQLRQIIMNIVINASEAIDDNTGVIGITTGCMDCNKSYLEDVWLDENISEGLYVYLEIADTGCGMDKETMAKIFDPFFTTKFTGRGLGMAAVLGIVRGHKGTIKVYSELNRGSTFKILLPASSRPIDIYNDNGDGHHDEWKGEGKVLLVDDEETVRGIGTEMLKKLGFTVITAGDGSEAVEQFKQNPDISFVILDLTMPHMDGEQCFRELRQLNPHVKVMMSSGYNEQEVTPKFVGKGLVGFIQKPYKMSALKEATKKI